MPARLRNNASCVCFLEGRVVGVSFFETTFVGLQYWFFFAPRMTARLAGCFVHPFFLRPPSQALTGLTFADLALRLPTLRDSLRRASAWERAIGALILL